MENKYDEPLQNEQDTYSYGEPVQDVNVENNANEYTYEELPPTGQQVPPSGTEYYQTGQTDYYQSSQNQPAPKTGLALASLILGIISLVLSCMGFNIILAIIAIILGAVYLSKKQQERRGMAIAGLVLGIISIALFVLIIVLAVVLSFGMLMGGDPLYTDMYNEILNGMY